MLGTPEIDGELLLLGEELRDGEVEMLGVLLLLGEEYLLLLTHTQRTSDNDQWLSMRCTLYIIFS